MNLPDFNLSQTSAVLSAFSAINHALPDSLSAFVPFKPHLVNQDERQLMIELTK